MLNNDYTKKQPISHITTILKVAVFLFLFLLLFVKVSYVLRPHGGSFLHIKTYGMQPRDTIDVVYVGGSSVFTYWAPMEAFGEYGFTSFNFANNTMPPQLEKYCIMEALKRQSPKLLVVDLRPFEGAESPVDEGPMYLVMYREATIRNFTDTFRYSLNRIQTIQNGVTKEMRRLNYHFDIAKYHTNWTSIISPVNWRYALNLPNDITKNFGGFEHRIRYGAFERPDCSGIKGELPFSETLNPVFLDLIDYCKDLETEVLFIIPPYEVHEENYKKHNYMRRIIENQGMRFLDCNEIWDEIGMDSSTDYFDGAHTQIFGAKKYTKWLGQYLKERYNLPDRRGDKKYADWQTAHERWVPATKENEQAVLELMPEDIRAKAQGVMG